jgi:hypothetical protein
MSLIIPANSAAASGGYQVDNSLRFNGSNDKLTITPGTAGNRKTWTWSSWIKRSSYSGIGGTTGETFFHCYDGSSSTRGLIQFQSHDHVPADTIKFSTGGSGSFGEIYTAAVNRDLSAWLHIVAVLDTTNSTATDRQRIYVNGVRLSVTVSNQVGLNYDGLINTTNEHEIGTHGGGSFFNGYMAETVFIDGQALTPTSFGEFDEDSGIWKPIKVSGLTFGDEGFYLDFENSGALGADVSGNTNNFTVNNLTAIDQTTDTPTNNFATWNALLRLTDVTLSEGNTQAAGGNVSYHGTYASIVPTSGKWYAEFKIIAPTYGQIGIITADTLIDGNRDVYSTSSNIYWQDNVTTIKYYLTDGDGTATSQGNAAVSGGSNSVATYTTNDIISIAIDLDNGKGYFAKNGTFVNSSNPADGTNSFTLASDYANGSTWFFGGNNYTVQANFGNAPYAISSGNTDGNDRGNFEYAPPSGYLSLCTANLSEVLG